MLESLPSTNPKWEELWGWTISKSGKINDSTKEAIPSYQPSVTWFGELYQTKQNKKYLIPHAQSTPGLFSILIKLSLPSLKNFMQSIFYCELPSREFK